MIASEQYAPETCSKPWTFRDRLDVLIVDDNKLSQVVAATMLDDLGCNFEFASTGLEALDLALRRNFDIILMDIKMPKMGGLEATRRIRKEEEERLGHQASIIAMTVMSLREDIASYLAAGMDGFLIKPVEGQGLRRIIRYAQRRVPRN
jgi:CheY-like chemotaxis protein